MTILDAWACFGLCALLGGAVLLFVALTSRPKARSVEGAGLALALRRRLIKRPKL